MNYKWGQGVSYLINAVIQPTIEFSKEMEETIRSKISKAVGDGILSDETIAKAADQVKRINDIISRDPKSDTLKGDKKEGVRNAVGVMNAISSAEGKVATEGLQMVKKGLGFLEEIHARLVSASPLLRTIESLFNLAVQLFFMPLGNKLAEVMIPAVIELVDQVTDLWATFEGKTLGQILESMLENGARIFGDYFNNLARQLEGEGTLLGSIASLLSAIGNFIQDGTLANLLKFGLNVLNVLVSHIKEVVATLVAFKVASLANQVATMWVIAASATSVLGTNVGAGYAAAAAGTAITAGIGVGAGLTTYNMMNGESFGDAALHAGASTLTHGGYDIGKAVRSKITGEASGVSSNKQTNVNNTFNFNGLTDSQLEKKVRNITNEQYNNHRLQANYG